MNSFLVATSPLPHTHTHSLLALSLLFGSCCAAWQLPGWLNYDTPRIMRGRARVRDGKDGVGEGEGGRFRQHSKVSLSFCCHNEFALFSMHVALSTHIPLPLPLPLSLFPFCCWMLRSWGEIGNYDSVNCRLLRHKLKFILWVRN